MNRFFPNIVPYSLILPSCSILKLNLRTPGSHRGGIARERNNHGALDTSPQTFAIRLHRDGAHGDALGTVVRGTLNGTLGELSAIAVLSYAGDAADGDFSGFATRIDELFGNGAPRLLEEIAVAFEATRRSPDSL